MMGRVFSAFGVLLVAAVVVAGSFFVPIGTSAVIEAETAIVPVGPVSVGCVGPTKLSTAPEDSSEDIAYDPQFDPTPPGSTTGVVGISAAQSYLDPASSEQTPAKAVWTKLGETQGSDLAKTEPGREVEVRKNSTETLVLTGTPQGTSPAAIAGASATINPSGDLRGIAAAPCQEARIETWLVGGTTSLGSSARVSLVNTGTIASTVTITVWGPTGQVALASGLNQVVPAGEEKVVLLEGSAIEQKRVAVHIVARGGPIVATMQDSSLAGLTPRGVSFVSGSADLATAQVIPGLAIAPSSASDEFAALIRLLAPGEVPAKVKVVLIGPDGEEDLAGLSPRTLVPGQVTDLSLAGLPEGIYTVRITSDQPVVAAGLVNRVGTGDEGKPVPVDHSWTPAQQASLSAIIALPSADSTRIGVSSEANTKVEVTVIYSDASASQTRTIEINSDQTSVIDLAEDKQEGKDVAGIILRSQSSPIVAAATLTVNLDDGVGVASISPSPASQLSGKVAVRTGQNIGLG